MELRKSLLSESKLLIKEISARCGFENEYYFSNRFKKHTGISPTEYRKLF
jgi:AraC-like DNA-binding protein